MKSTATVSQRRCICPRLSVVVCIWHLGYTAEASAAAFTQSYQVFQRAAFHQEPTYRVRGILTDGFDSTIKSLRTLFPGARLGNCLRHAINKLPRKLRPSPPQSARRCARSSTPCCTGRVSGRACGCLRWARRLRRFADHVATMAGVANGERVRQWFQDKKAGWYAVLEDPQMPVSSTLLDQAHNAIDRKLFAMKGFHHPRWASIGVSHGAGTPVQPGALSASGPACRPMWGGSGRRASTDTGLVPQPANPHLRRLSMRVTLTLPLNPVECGNGGCRDSSPRGTPNGFSLRMVPSPNSSVHDGIVCRLRLIGKKCGADSTPGRGMFRIRVKIGQNPLMSRWQRVVWAAKVPAECPYQAHTARIF